MPCPFPAARDKCHGLSSPCQVLHPIIAAPDSTQNERNRMQSQWLAQGVVPSFPPRALGHSAHSRPNPWAGKPMPLQSPTSLPVEPMPPAMRASADQATQLRATDLKLQTRRHPSPASRGQSGTLQVPCFGALAFACDTFLQTRERFSRPSAGNRGSPHPCICRSGRR